MPGAEVTSTQVSVTHVINGAHIVLTETVNHVSTFAKVLGEGTYSELIWAIAIVIVGQVVLTFTRWGLYTVAVGSNKLGAAEAGVRVRLVMIRNFILCSTAGGFVGIMEAVRASSVQPDVAGANEILFEAIVGGGDRRHAAGRGLGDRRGRADRGAVPGHPARRAHPQGRQRRLPALLPGPCDHPGDDHQRVRAARAQGVREVADRPVPARDDRRARSRARGRRAARRAHRQALRSGDGAARRQPAPAQRRDAGPARRQRGGQVDA